MKIGVLLHPYGEKELAGLGRAIFELTRAMIAASPEHEFLIFVKGNLSRKPEFPGTNWHMHSLGSGLLWLDWLRNVPRADIYLFNTPVLPHFWWRKSVVIALDFAYLQFSPQSVRERIKRFFLKRRHRAALHRAVRIVAISEATRQDVMRYFGAPPGKVETIYLGYNRICSIPEQAVSVPDKFFLFVGVLKERKNVGNIIKAFARFYSSHTEYKLLIAGKAVGSYASGLKQWVVEQKLETSVRFLGYRSEGELAYLYRRAAALVYPSIIEGFGFPVLEAMDCGTPVITSMTSSLPELVGDAALLVDPQDVSQLAGAMERMIEDDLLRTELIEKGRARARGFSWDKTAERFLKLTQNA